MYPNLKLELFRRGTRQNQLAKILGINEATLSKIIHGYREPSDVQKRSLANYLAVDEAWLFEKFDGAIPARIRSNGDIGLDKTDGES